MSASARSQDIEYLYASIANVSNFVSVKLSGKNNYHVWKSQMLCLFDSHNMGGIVDDTFAGPTYSGTETLRQYDSLAKGWILGSVSEGVLSDVHNIGSAKDVWEKLKSIYDTPICLQEDSTSKKYDEETVKEVDKDVVSAEASTVEGTNSIAENKKHKKITWFSQDSTSKKSDTKTEKEVGKDVVSAKAKTVEGANSINIIVDQHMVQMESNARIFKAKPFTLDLLIFTKRGEWSKVESKLKRNKDLVTEVGSTMLHIAVGRGYNDFVKKLLPYMNDEHILQQRSSDGSTALHIAATVGNTYVADLLIKRNRTLLRVKDHKGVEPLQKSYEYMHLDTIGYLLKALNHDNKIELQSSLTHSVHHDDDIAADLLVNAISAKQYSLALELVQNYPKSASRSDDVLIALAKNFPSGLDYWEKLVYPSLDNIWKPLLLTMLVTLALLFFPVSALVMIIYKEQLSYKAISTEMFKSVILTVPAMLASAFGFIWLLILIICFPFFSLYYLLWKGANILAFAPIKRIENKKKDLDEAKDVLYLVCDRIDKLENSGGDHYNKAILVAACRNAYKVVKCILARSPKAIEITDKSGYDIIQLAILNRSEQVYNLIYDLGEHKNLYRIYKDSYKNNILHLACRLAPSSVLNQKTGATLQLQRELQWREELKKLVFPTYITEENIFKETPDMVFTREHENLVKEGEKWMKTTAESCSITAALITTIIFAAAITVPGGNNQERGTPLFKKESAFIIFAISDAISLFASSTALLVFLSILTTRFAEKDFLVSLPRRLFIGLFSLLLSTITMMIAFSATLFLVFCDKKPWMLLPISGLAFIPIASFITLQFPLMVDLFRSTYSPIFGKKKESEPLIFRTLETLLHIVIR